MRTQAHGDPTTLGVTPGEEVRSETLAQGALLGRYVVLEFVGEGGMGEVYRAYDPKLRREVALKLLRARAASEGARQRLVREAQAMAQLSHPNVVAVYDVDQLDDRVYLALEYVEGVTLAQWLTRESTVAQRVAAFIDAGRGLAAAHAAAIVHRDFKPGNVLVGRDGRVRVMDFGLALAPSGRPSDSGATDGSHDPDAHESSSEARLTREGMVMGTPVYMAPEQHEGADTDARTDQFSFCVSLCEALSGRRPFAGRSIRELAAAKREPPVLARVPGASRRLLRALTRGMLPRPADRFPDMLSLLAELEAASRSRHAWLPVALSVGAVVTVASVAWPRANDPCAQAGAVIDPRAGAEAWNAIEASLRAGPPPVPETSLATMKQRLAVYEGAWSETRLDACEATRVRHAQSDAMFDRRVECLGEHQAQYAATIDLLAEADPALRGRALDMVLGLPRIDDCSDTTRLLQATDPPPAEAATEVAKIRAALASIATYARAGKFDVASTMLQPLIPRADALAYLPLVADVRLQYARLQHSVGDEETSRDALQQAYDAALRSKHDPTAISAATRMAGLLSKTLDAHEASRWWASQAVLLLDRTDAPPSRRCEVNLELGEIALNEGRMDDAAAAMDEALGWAEKSPHAEENRPRVHAAMSGLHARVGNYAEMQRYAEQARAAYAALYGPDHPRTTHMDGRLVIADITAGRFQAALERQDRVIEIESKMYGAESLAVASHYHNRANALIGLRRLDEAQAELEHARKIWLEKYGEDHHQLAEAEAGLGQLAAERGDPVAAETHQRRALTILTSHFGPAHPGAAEARTNIGNALLEQNKPGEALAEFRAAADALAEHGGKDSGYYGEALRSIARAQIRLGEAQPAVQTSEEAIAILAKAASHSPTAAVAAQLTHAEALLAAERYGEAVAAYTKASADASVLEDPGPAAEAKLGLAKARAASTDPR